MLQSVAATRAKADGLDVEEGLCGLYLRDVVSGLSHRAMDEGGGFAPVGTDGIDDVDVVLVAEEMFGDELE